MLERETMSETAKSESLSIFVKTIGPAEEATGSKGPPVLVIASFDRFSFLGL